MKTLNFIVVGLLAGTVCLTAQTSKSTMDLLMQHKWTTVLDFGSGGKINDSFIFTTTEFIDKFYTDEDKSESELVSLYYLSDSVETLFDPGKVGKVKNGKYLISKNKRGVVFCLEITKLTETELVFSPVTNKKNSPTPPVYIASPKK